MQAFLDEIQATFDCGIYSTTLASALLVPDACGAIEHPHEKNGARYVKWYDTFLPTHASPRMTFNGEVAWKLRNGMMHETALALKAYGYDKVYFTVPNPRKPLARYHMNTSEHGGETMLNIDLQTFVSDMITGANRWLQTVAEDAEKQRRLDLLIQLRPHGWIHMVGVPLIA